MRSRLILTINCDYDLLTRESGGTLEPSSSTNVYNTISPYLRYKQSYPGVTIYSKPQRLSSIDKIQHAFKASKHRQPVPYWKPEVFDKSVQANLEKLTTETPGGLPKLNDA